MNLNKALLLSVVSILLFIIVMVSFYFLLNIKNVNFNKIIIAEENNIIRKDINNVKNHKAYYVDQSFYGDMESFRQKSNRKKVYGGIISHHFLMIKEIAGLISSFVKQQPKNIIIIGPNHFGVGDGNILISKYNYDTPYGIVQNNTKIANQLIGSGAVKLDESPFIKEHSVSALVGIIKYFLPKANIVPIIVKKHTSATEREKLASELTKVLSENDIVLGSVDFSHHINPIASEFHDERTISIIENFDFDRLQSVEVDSPESLDVVLRYLQDIGATKMYGTHTNMSTKVEDPFLEDGTSYLFASFVKGSQEKDTKISVLSFGDLMLGRDVGKAIKNGDNPFEDIEGVEGNFVRGVDIISANLEGPITTAKNCIKKAYSFKFDPKVTELLVKYNFNAFNLSNNHAFDCHDKGYEDTKKYLDASGLFHFGGNSDNRIKIKNIADKKIAFVGIDNTIASKNNALYKQKVVTAKNESDYVMVNIHWGQEYRKEPTKKQIDLAHDLIDSGADVIIGHHPHVVESGEIYKGKAIFYSLGNFIFDQIGAEENQGLGVGIVFDDKFINFYLFPFDIIKYHPKLKNMKNAKQFCDSFINNMNIDSKNICEFSL